MKRGHDRGPSGGLRHLLRCDQAKPTAALRIEAPAVRRFSGSTTRSLHDSPVRPEAPRIRDNRTSVANHLFAQAVFGTTAQASVRATGVALSWLPLPRLRPRPSFDPCRDAARNADGPPPRATGPCS